MANKDGSRKELKGKLKATTEKSFGKAKSFLMPVVDIVQKLPCLLLLAMVPLAFVVTFSDSGQYLNSYLFYQPVAKLKSSMGWDARLDDRIRIVMLEDGSLKKLGRKPNFSEWYGIAKYLFQNGFETVLLLDNNNLESDIGRPGSRHESGTFIVGAVNYPGRKNLRALKVDDIPSDLFTKNLDSEFDGQIEKSNLVLAPSERVFHLIDRLGDLSIESAFFVSAPMGYQISKDRILPNMGLLADPSLRWKGGQFETDAGKIPRSADDHLYFDFVLNKDLYKPTTVIPVQSFFDKEDMTRLAGNLNKKVMERLKGGKIAVLAPEVYTGSRFVDTPLGKKPSFVAVVSMINSTLKGHFVTKPFSHELTIILVLPFFFLLLMLGNTTFALVGTALAALGQMILSSYLLINTGWLLPCAQIVLVAGAGWGVRLAHHLIRTLSEKLKLSRDLEMGSLVQDLLLPSNLEGEVGEWEYRISFRPYGPMSGDWVQVFSPENGAGKGSFAVIAIGDVVGKGPSAALNTAAIAGVWNHFRRQWERDELDLQKFLRALDVTIHDTFKGQQNTTLSLAVLMEDKIIMTSCAAPSWFKITPNESIARVSIPPQNPLGFEPVEVYRFKEVTPKDGEVFLAYSDGVMDGSAARRRFQKSIKAGELSEETGELFEELEKRAIVAGADDILPDDFTLLQLRRKSSQVKIAQKAS